MRRGILVVQQVNTGATRKPAEWPALYDELRRLAAAFLRNERRDHTLQPTALVHEAFLRLAGGGPADPSNRVAFLAAAANVMRRVLVDHARARNCRKRGGDAGSRVPLETSLLRQDAAPIDVLELEDALNRLTALDARLSRLVELRYFAGLTEAEAADVLEVSRRAAQLDWRAARAWLKRELAG